MKRSARRSVLAMSAVPVLLAALAVPAPVAAAPTDRAPSVSIDAMCNYDRGEWVLTWTVANPYPVAGTLGNIRVQPAGAQLTGLADRVLPGGEVVGTERLPASVSTSTITFDVNWDDGLVTYDVSGSLNFYGCQQVPRQLDSSWSAYCDRTAGPGGEWVITWRFTDYYLVPATLGNIRVAPAGSQLVGLPNRLLPQQPVTATQRIPAQLSSVGTITLDVNWDDGVVSYNMTMYATITGITCSRGWSY